MVWEPPRLCQPEYADLGEDQRLAPILPPGATLEDWLGMRPSWLRRWQEFLGQATEPPGQGDAQPINSTVLPWARATEYRQPTAPGVRQLVVILEPLQPSPALRPAALVPFYHPDDMAGWNFTLGKPDRKRLPTQFGRRLVEQGYVVACVEAFPFNTVPDPKSNEGFAWWKAAAKKLLADNPRWTGMGRLVRDTSRALDLLLAQPGVDPGRVVAIGHSLGGKMAFYTGCLDDRVKAVIASDFGIGWSFTNWDAPWYLGPKIHDPGLRLAHHQLLALLAPRPFLLVAGQFDKRESWQYLNAARPVYDLYGRGGALACLDHATGHTPPPQAMRAAYRWLAEQFGLPPAKCCLDSE
ncbi:MAG TPA: dienelactone hydrolase family protein [Candidatus Brocadiia bacterium]|nr:dienelactone hydrolase family protein [Candidatus Brocadiia bacterium]